MDGGGDGRIDDRAKWTFVRIWPYLRPACDVWVCMPARVSSRLLYSPRASAPAVGAAHAHKGRSRHVLVRVEVLYLLRRRVVRLRLFVGLCFVGPARPAARDVDNHNYVHFELHLLYYKFLAGEVVPD
jgi:hypothetical protein